MKKILMLAAYAIAFAALFSCEKQPGTGNGGGTDPQEKAEPTMEWAANPEFLPTEIEEEMDVNIVLKAEAGIKRFVVGVESSVLSPLISQMTSDKTSDMDLIGDEALIASLSMFLGDQFPTGDALLNKTNVNFELSTLVPLILTLGPENGSDHLFTLTLTDNEDRELKKTLTFHYTGTSSLSVLEADLWANTAKVSVLLTEDVAQPSVYYTLKGKEVYHEAALQEDGTYLIVPEYESSKNDAGLDIFTVKEGTGIYAGNTYLIELRNGSEVAAAVEYASAEGDAIPNGDMGSWSKKSVTSGTSVYELDYPNAAGDSFWDSGNNPFTKDTPLCAPGDEDGTALLSARNVLNLIFAPGNLYTGDFNYSGMKGTAKFGKEYGWTARPASLKVRYKASVGTIDKEGSYDPDKGSYSGQPDTSRIYAVVVDWSDQHAVTSGIGAPSGMWDPCLATSVAEGSIIGYASLDVTESSSEFGEAVEIPFHWYDTSAKPASGHYSVVISFATSTRGDYLTGCSGNTMVVDSVEWGY